MAKKYASKSPLTEADKALIRLNSKNMTINKLADLTGNSYWHISRFLDEEGLPRKVQRRELQKNELGEAKYKVINLNGKQPQKIERPPAVYTNTNWERYGEEILNRVI